MAPEGSQHFRHSRGSSCTRCCFVHCRSDAHIAARARACVCVCPKFKHPCGEGPMQPSKGGNESPSSGEGSACRGSTRPTLGLSEEERRGCTSFTFPRMAPCKAGPLPTLGPLPPRREAHPSSAGAALNFNSGYQVWPFKLLSQTFFIFFSLSSQALIALRVSAGVRMMF